VNCNGTKGTQPNTTVAVRFATAGPIATYPDMNPGYVVFLYMFRDRICCLPRSRTS
jgi:hypothetical protein